MPRPDDRPVLDSLASRVPNPARGAVGRRAYLDGAGWRSSCCRARGAVSGVSADVGPLAEHGEVLCPGVGVVVAVPDRLRARLGCGDGRGPRPIPRLAAHRRLAGVGLDRAPIGTVQRGHDRAASAGGLLVLPLSALQRRRGRVAPLRAGVLGPAPLQADARAPRAQARSRTPRRPSRSTATGDAADAHAGAGEADPRQLRAVG